MAARASAGTVSLLLQSDDPAIVYRARAALGEPLDSRGMRSLGEQVRSSARVRTLLAKRDPQGRIACAKGVYAKWQGPHWIMASLADLGYPQADESLLAARDQILDHWLNAYFYEEFEASRTPPTPRSSTRCMPCEVSTGSERALGTMPLSRLRGWRRRSFLSRHLYRRQSTGSVIRAESTRLHYPLYWHYDILQALKVLTEMGRADDPRCVDALDLLERKQLPDGGWAAESRYYTVSPSLKLGADYVDWGGTSKRKMNPWVTTDAISVLRRAGRWME